MAASGLGLMALLLDTMGVSFTIPTSTCELELDTFRKGLLSCMSFLGIVMTAHLWGFLADTLGRNKSIRYSLIGAILFTALAALVPNFWAIIVLRLLSGMRWVYNYTLISSEFYNHSFTTFVLMILQNTAYQACHPHYTRTWER